MLNNSRTNDCIGRVQNKFFHNPKTVDVLWKEFNIKAVGLVRLTPALTAPAPLQKMRALFLIALVASASALSLPILGGLLSDLPILGALLGGNGGSLPLVGNLPLLGNIVGTLGGTLGQLLDSILQNVAIIVNAVLEIAEDLLDAVALIVNGLLNGLLTSAQVQKLLALLPQPLPQLVTDLIAAVQCIVNQLPNLVPPVQKAVIQLIGLLTSPLFAQLPANTQLQQILAIIGELAESEIQQVQQILQILADGLNGGVNCPYIVTGIPQQPLPGFSMPVIGGGASTPSGLGLL